MLALMRWHKHTIQSVEGKTLILEGGSAFAIMHDFDMSQLAAGDVIEVKTRNDGDGILGERILGVRWKGGVIFDLNEQEVAQRDKEARERSNRERQQAFAASRYEERLGKLPEWMQTRQKMWALTSSDYLWRFGIYDLAILEVAHAILEKYKTREEMNDFVAMTPEAKMAEIPVLTSDMTGNMVGHACMTAYGWMTGQIMLHSGMCRLLGCEAMNCPTLQKDQ